MISDISTISVQNVREFLVFVMFIFLYPSLPTSSFFKEKNNPLPMLNITYMAQILT